MVVCPNCGRESDQAGASYCLYCGSSFSEPRQASSSLPAMQATTTYGGAPVPVQAQARYQRALSRVERLGSIVAALAVITLILVLV